METRIPSTKPNHIHKCLKYTLLYGNTEKTSVKINNCYRLKYTLLYGNQIYEKS